MWTRFSCALRKKPTHQPTRNAFRWKNSPWWYTLISSNFVRLQHSSTVGVQPRRRFTEKKMNYGSSRIALCQHLHLNPFVPTHTSANTNWNGVTAYAKHIEVSVNQQSSVLASVLIELSAVSPFRSCRHARSSSSVDTHVISPSTRTQG